MTPQELTQQFNQKVSSTLSNIMSVEDINALICSVVPPNCLSLATAVAVVLSKPLPKYSLISLCLSKAFCLAFSASSIAFCLAFSASSIAFCLAFSALSLAICLFLF